MPDGEIDSKQANLLKEMGRWLELYGETIYGTRGGPFKPGYYGISTRKENIVFVHILGWSHDIVLPPIPAKILRSYMPGGGSVRVLQTTNGVEISVKKNQRKPVDTIVALVLDRSALEIPAVDVQSPRALTAGCKATASNVYCNDPQYSAEKAVDNNEETRWATDLGVKSAWLEVDLGKPVSFSRAIIKQAYPELKRIKKFTIEYRENDRWIVCYKGGVMGETENIRFRPVTARFVRLNIVESTDGPTIKEFSLF